MAEVNMTFVIKQSVEDIIRQILISDIGELWDGYCYENNVPPEIKLHGIEFLEQFANSLTKK
jgi:hypothetical protein